MGVRLRCVGGWDGFEADFAARGASLAIYLGKIVTSRDHDFAHPNSSVGGWLP